MGSVPANRSDVVGRGIRAGAGISRGKAYPEMTHHLLQYLFSLAVATIAGFVIYFVLDAIFAVLQSPGPRWDKWRSRVSWRSDR
jgi:hypothetical protein